MTRKELDTMLTNKIREDRKITRNELDAIFTNKVKEYFENGFIINTKTMGGSQGEIARVDIRKDDVLLRLYIETEGSDYGERINIITGKDPQISHHIWNGRLEIIEKSVYLNVATDKYIYIEEAELLDFLNN